MKAKVEKLAKGIFEQEELELKVSISSIEGAIQTSEILSGSFLISEYNQKSMEGIIYSGSRRVHLSQTEFQGTEIEIEYQIEVKGMLPKEILKGEIDIVSDAGEISIPYEIRIEAPYAPTSMGKIRNLFHFTNLVKKNYEEALKLFYKPEFPDIFLARTPKIRATYESLIKGISPKTALEEFLVFVNKKSRVFLALEEEQKEFSDLEEAEGDTVILKKDGWGYLEIDVTKEGDFIQLSKKKLTTEIFGGNIYEYRYTLEAGAVHAGWNYGKIIFTSPYQKLEYEVIIHKKMTADRRSDLQQRIRYGIADLAEEYFSFRLHKTNTDMWCKQSLKTLIQIAEEDEMPLFLKLLKAQLYTTQKKMREAGWILQEADKHFQNGAENEVILYCYYLYVSILYRRDSAMVKETVKEVWKLYQKGGEDWRILWLLLYLDEEYMLNKSLRIIKIKEQFIKGCISPFLYYEVCIALNEQPELLRVLNKFELQCLWWGSKHSILQEKTVLQVAEISSAEKKCDPILIKILTMAYGKYHNKMILEAILSLLLRHGMVSEKYFKWFEKGVLKDIKITGLYEAYMNTLPEDYSEELPKVITMYFAFDNSLGEKRRAMLYANILQHNKENQVLLKNYKTIMERFALKQMEKGRIDQNLAVLYRRVMSKSLLDEQIAKKYPVILLTKYFLTKEKKMRFVIIRHKEIEEEWKIPILNGEAYFPIYTEDYGIVLEDEQGRRFAENIEYTIKDLFREQGILKYCYEIEQGHPLLGMHLCEREGLHKKDETGLEYYTTVIHYKEIKPVYRNHILQQLIEYYSENYDAELLEQYLRQLETEYMTLEDQRNITELFLVRSMYGDAREMLLRNGYEGMSAARILKFCLSLLWEEETPREEFLLELCEYTYRKGKYNEAILQYLLRFFEGGTKKLFELWQAARDFEVGTEQLDERFINQMLFTDTYVAQAIEIFEDYYRYHTKQELVRAYLGRQSYLFFALEMVTAEKTFELLQRELKNGQEILDISKMALLKYYAQQEEKNFTIEQIEQIGLLLQELVRKGKIFSFYKTFEEYQVLPPILRDKTILEYRTKKEMSVGIHYMLQSSQEEETEYETGTMEEMGYGIYTKQFILFYGELLQYYMEEEREGKQYLTESDSILVSDWDFSYGESRFHLLNDMCASLDIGDDKTLLELIKTYAQKRYFTKEYFKPIE